MADLPNPTSDAAHQKQTGEAAAKVFSTPELMEKILLNLSMRQLFGVQRTSKAFIDTINGSIKLQRHMFLRDDPAFDYYVPEEPRLNPLMQQVLFVPSENITRRAMQGIGLDGVEQRAFFRQASASSDYDLVLHFRTILNADARKYSAPVNAYRAVGRKKSRPVRQSWRRTLVTQGAPEKLQVTFNCHLEMDYFCDSEECDEPFMEQMGEVWEQDDDGDRPWSNVTLGAVVDKAEELCEFMMEFKPSVEMMNDLLDF